MKIFERGRLNAYFDFVCSKNGFYFDLIPSISVGVHWRRRTKDINLDLTISFFFWSLSFSYDRKHVK